VSADNNLEHTVVYTMQTVKIVLLVILLAKFDITYTSLGEVSIGFSICKAYVIGNHALKDD